MSCCVYVGWVNNALCNVMVQYNYVCVSITDESANRLGLVAETAAATGRTPRYRRRLSVLTVTRIAHLLSGMVTALCGRRRRSSQPAFRSSSVMAMTTAVMLVMAFCCLDSSRSQILPDQLPTVAYVSPLAFCWFVTIAFWRLWTRKRISKRYERCCSSCCC